MQKLKTVCSIYLAIILLFCTTGAMASTPASEYGASANPTGEPIGGGAGYSRLILKGDYTVSTKPQLLDALARARYGEVIYIEPNASIDLTGMTNIAVPAGVTLAGNRGYQGSAGPLIYSNLTSTYPSLFMVQGEKVRFTGLRLRGPSPDAPSAVGLNIQADNVEVDNCEIYNWSQSGVAMMNAQNAYIHHNNIHHCKQQGLGYPVVVNKATALIEANIIDWYRHAIAGTGRAGTGYEARYNIIGPNSISHALDMHGGTDYCANQTAPCTEQEIMTAGSYVNIHHNDIQITVFNAIIIRGVAADYVEVHHNVFTNAYPEFCFRQQYFSGGNTNVYQNLFGPNKRLVDSFITPSPFIYEQGASTVYALVDGRRVFYGFSNPPASQAATVVTGQLKVELVPTEIRPLPGVISSVKAFECSAVEIRLDNSKVIYSGVKPPASGEIVIDTTQLPNGVHRLTLKISGNVEIPLTQTVTFRTNN